MDMAMKDSLARILAAVHSDVKSGNRFILPLNGLLLFVE
jgi:hypothetical protein